jgi:hypothetical protein
MLEAVAADELVLILGQDRGGQHVHRIAVVTALAFDRLEFGHVILEPFGNGPGQNASALAERAFRMEATENRFPDEGGLVRQTLQDFGQMVIYAEGDNSLFLLGHGFSWSGWKINSCIIIVS